MISIHQPCLNILNPRKPPAVDHFEAKVVGESVGSGGKVAIFGWFPSNLLNLDGFYRML